MQLSNTEVVSTGNAAIDALNNLIRTAGQGFTVFEQARQSRKLANLNIERLRAGLTPYPTAAAYPQAYPDAGGAYGASPQASQTKTLLIVGGGLLLLTLLILNARSSR